MSDYEKEWTTEQRRNGWSCHHRDKDSGPCERCHPGSGLCPNCFAPFDLHKGRDWKCPVAA